MAPRQGKIVTMEPLKFIACDVLVGLARKPYPWFHPDIEDLQHEMARLQISAAVVRHRQCIENSPHWGNAVLVRETSGHANLISALCLTPDGEPDAHSLEAMLTTAFASGMRIAWMSPREHSYSVRPWCSGGIYAACAAAHLPLLLDYRQVTLDDVDEIMTAHPRLPLILLQVPRFGRHRSLYILLERHPSLHLCLSSAYSVHEGVADLVQEFGPTRFVWGSGYPEAEGGASVALLTYADLPANARAAIAHGNIERLLTEVRP
jgi:hypothetical protein